MTPTHRLNKAPASAVSVLATGAMLMAASTAPLAATTTLAGGDAWQFGAVVYGWFPSVSGDLAVDLGDGGNGIEVDASDVIDKLQFTFMGSFEARKGAWSGFADVVYLSLGDSKSNSVSVPTGATRTLFDADMDLTGWVWTLGGSYSIWNERKSHLDLLAGARLLSLDIDLEVSGGGPGQRDRDLSASESWWTGIVGAKGRFALSDRWFMPYYADVGTGQIDLTWQAFGGIGYAFDWGEVSLTYRHLAYDQDKGDGLLENLSFGGPKLGVGFRF